MYYQFWTSSLKVGLTDHCYRNEDVPTSNLPDLNLDRFSSVSMALLITAFLLKNSFCLLFVTQQSMFLDLLFLTCVIFTTKYFLHSKIFIFFKKSGRGKSFQSKHQTRLFNQLLCQSLFFKMLFSFKIILYDQSHETSNLFSLLLLKFKYTTLDRSIQLA